MFIITQEGSTSRCQSYLPGKLEFIQMFIFSGIEFFEEIKEALVEKMCFQIFGDILLKCWCKCQVRSTDTTRFSVSEIQVEGLFRDSYQLGYSDNCNQFWLLYIKRNLDWYWISSFTPGTAYACVQLLECVGSHCSLLSVILLIFHTEWHLSL